MKLKFVIPSLLVVVAAGILAFNALSKNRISTDASSKKEVIASIMEQVLEKLHYAPKDINDDFSKKVFKQYIDLLDGEKKFFYQSDIDYLKKYETSLDEEIKGVEPLDFYREADSILNIRMTSARELYPVILSQPFDFTKIDSIQLKSSKLSFPENKETREIVWRKKLVLQTLIKLLDLKKFGSKAGDTASIKNEYDEELEVDARKAIEKSYYLYFDRIDSH